MAGQLSREELEREYRAALRREVQANHRAEDAETALLHVKGRLLSFVQEIDRALLVNARVHRHQLQGADLERVDADPLARFRHGHQPR